MNIVCTYSKSHRRGYLVYDLLYTNQDDERKNRYWIIFFGALFIPQMQINFSKIDFHFNPKRTGVFLVEYFSQLSFDSEMYTKSAAVADFVYISESNESCEK